jgi:hypothetical protein
MPGGCKCHPCVCSGALMSRVELPRGPQPSSERALLGLLPTASQDAVAQGAGRHPHGPADPPPSASGRTMRLVLGSLLL